MSTSEQARDAGPTVLVVEDDPALAELFVRCLQGVTAAIERAVSGSQVLDWVAARPDCLLVLDYSLRDTTAHELLEALHQRGSFPPFLIMTGQGDEELAVRMMKMGARDYLVKDQLIFERLPAAVARVLREIAGERRLESSERRLRAVFEGANDCFLVLDRHGVIDCNTAALAMFGARSKEQLLGTQPADLSPPVQPDSRRSDVALQGLIDQALAGESQRFEWVHRRRDGVLFPAEVQLSPIDIEGRVALLVAVRDITGRRAAEGALRQSEERYRRLLQSMTDFGYSVRVEADVPLATMRGPGCVAVTGYTQEEFAANAFLWLEIVDPQDREAVTAHARSTARAHVQRPLEHRIWHKDGRLRWVRNTLVARQSGGGEAVDCDGVVEDITARKLAEEAVREEQARFDHLVSAIPEGICFKDRRSRYLRINPALTWRFGLRSPAEAIGLSDADFYSAARARQTFEDEQRLMQSGEPMFDREELETWRDGRSNWVSTTKLPLFDAAGGIVGLVVVSRDVTARRRAEDALRESEARYRQLFSASVAGVALHEIICDAAGRPQDYRFLEVNPAFEAMTGIAADAARGRTVRELMPETEELWIERYGRVALTGESDHFESFSAALDKHFEVTAYCTKPGQFAAVVLDITARKQAAAALARNEAELAAINDHTPVSLCVIDEDARIVRANLAAAAFAGCSREELQAGGVGGLIGCAHDQDQPGVWGLDEACETCSFRRAMRETMEQGTSHHQLEFRCTVDRPGRKAEQVLLCSCAPIPVEGRRLVLLALEDVTARREAEARLREQAALLDIAQDAILVCDLDDRIVYWNKGAERLYGWSLGEAQSRHSRMLLYPNPLSDEVSRADSTVRERGEWSGELAQVARDRRAVTVQSRWTLVRDGAGRPKSILIVNTDITEEKRLTIHLQRSQRLESVGTLASGVAHDLNNVLSPIVMSLHMLRGMIVDQNGLSLVETMEQCARRAADIVRQMLTFARGASGQRVELQPKLIVQEIARIVRETFPRAIAVSCDFGHGLGSVLGDHTQIQQVLMNLCVNARDAMPGGGTLTIRADNLLLAEDDPGVHPRARAGRYALITVADTGGGMTPEIIERIFDPFFTTKPVGKGTGLGLAMALDIVEKHKGFIQVASEPGKGTTFRVFLPALESSGRTPGPQVAVDETPRGRGETVLVVDDEVSVRTAVAGMLLKFGYQAHVACSGAEALELFRSSVRPFDVVLTDLMMPGIDGSALIRQLRLMNPAVPVITMTGLGDDAVAALTPGGAMPQVLQKPFSTGQLLEAVDQAIRAPAVVSDGGRRAVGAVTGMTEHAPP